MKMNKKIQAYLINNSKVNEKYLGHLNYFYTLITKSEKVCAVQGILIMSCIVALFDQVEQILKEDYFDPRSYQIASKLALKFSSDEFKGVK